MIKRLNPVRDKAPKVIASPSANISNRVNKACKFFPCHKGLENCTFCYCPFYPCLDEKKGRYVYSSRIKKKIWSCENCSWIHKRKVTESIFALIRESKYPLKKNRYLKSGKTGIIILSHGSKLKKANVSLDKIVEVIKQKTGLKIILPAYLQFCQPDLAKSVKNLITRGCQTVIIVPFFLFNGNHVTRDIPHIIGKEKAKYPKVNFIYTKNLGDDTRTADIVSDMIGKAVHSGNPY